jgi:HK97 family phage portal protein
LGTPTSSLSKKIASFFSVPKKKETTHVRTLSIPAQWSQIAEAFGSYSGAGSCDALKVSVVFACIDLIAKYTASLPLKPMRKTESGQEVAKDHYLYRLFRNPHPFYSGYRLRYVTKFHTLQYGESFVPIMRENGVPVGFDIWNPCDVEHIIEGNKLYWVNTKLKKVVNDEDMIHDMWYSEDGIRGKSVLSFAKDTIDLSRSGAKMSSELYKNFGWQPGFFSVGGDLSAEQAELMSKSISANYWGEENKNTVMVMDNDTKWVPFGGSLKESEYTETQERVVIEVCRFLGVPPSKMGIRNANVSYNSLEQEDKAFFQDCIQPQLESLEEEYERKLILDDEAEEMCIKHEVKGRLRGDTASTVALLDMGLRSGLYSINDALRSLDMNTIGPEGDERYVNAAQVPLSKLFSGELEKGEKSIDEAIKSLIAEAIHKSKQNGNADKILQHKS